MTNSSDDKILEDSIFKVGKVISIDGRDVKVAVDKSKNSSNLLYKGELLKNISVGGYIKITKGFTVIVGIVEGESIAEDSRYTDKAYRSNKDKISRILNIKLLGFFDGVEFKRGIKELPLIDNECFLLNKKEFVDVHHFVEEDDEPLKIGKLSLEKGQDIELGINSLFASHVGIFGNTGSGKSYTLSKIYNELFQKYKDKPNFVKNSEFVLIDFNGEYVNKDVSANDDTVLVEGKYKKRYILSTKAGTTSEKYPFTSKELQDPAIWTVILQATEKTQQPFVKRVLSSRFIETVVSTETGTKTHIGNLLLNALTKNDRNLEKGQITSFINELKALFDDVGTHGLQSVYSDYVSSLQFHSTANSYFYQESPGDSGRLFSDKPRFEQVVVRDKIDNLLLPLGSMNPLQRIRLKFLIVYYDEIFRGFSNSEHLSPLMKRLEDRSKDFAKVIKVDDSIDQTRNIEIISLKDVNLDVRKLFPLLICKKKYEAHKSKDSGTMLNIIVDEAHNILSMNSERESAQWKDYRLETFEEIIKEGRKFGAFMTIASQRPHDITPTIISQLHNYFLHRLINSNDTLSFTFN
jgi:DNA helicase HerA-like ATPase